MGQVKAKVHWILRISYLIQANYTILLGLQGLFSAYRAGTATLQGPLGSYRVLGRCITRLLAASSECPDLYEVLSLFKAQLSLR